MKVEKKDFTPENVLEAVQTLEKHWDEPFSTLRATLQSNGYNWTHEEFLALNEERKAKGLESEDDSLFNSLDDGELSTGVAVVAHAQQSPEELAFMRDKHMDIRLDRWSEMLAEREGLSLADHGPKDLNVDAMTQHERKLLEGELIRVVWKEVEQPEGAPKDTHNVVFAYACDEKGFLRSVWKDEPANMPNPYMVNQKKNGEVKHDVTLSQEMFDRLKAYSGPGGGQWQGCVETVHNPTNLEKGRYIPDLTKAAEDLQVLRKPSSDFESTYHDAFVKDSLVALREKRRLPEGPSVTGPEDQAQFGS